MTSATPLDEMVDGKGGLRPRWRTLLGALTELGRDTLVERAARLDRALEEEGVTSLLPGALAAGPRCDPIPLLLAESEFSTLSAGLAQRARLLDAILDDCYGPARLLATGALPPALIYANPGFLRPCSAPAETAPWRMLRFYAADVIRGPEGEWRVIADHTGWADGLAAALEHRQMLSRAVPEIFHSHSVAQLRPFLEAWQDSLQRLIPPAVSGGVALLTPGHGDPRWYDHVLLARELQCALVEGGDLTVRGGGLFLKTLRGLQPIGVLLSAVDGQLVDPLELAPDGTGVTGLLDIARSNAVRIVNHPGAAVAEAPALSAFLPTLAERLLGEPLALDGVPTRWLGQPGAVEALFDDFDRWAIRSATDSRSAPERLHRLSPERRERLFARIAEAPWRFAAAAPVGASVTPCLGKGGFVPRGVVLRLFLFDEGGEWRAMQGGLARTMPSEEALAWRLPEQGLAKDVWVLAETPGAIVGPGVASRPALAIRRTPGDLPSRAADNFFWLGRYLERLEGTARLQRAAISRIVRPTPSPRQLAELQVLADCLGTAHLIDRDINILLGAELLAAALLRAAREDGPTGGLLGRVARMTGLLRDRLSGDMYAVMSRAVRELADALRQIPGLPEGEELDALSQALGGVVRFSATVAGLAAENMVRGGGRLFLDLGRRVERARAIADELACALRQPLAPAQPGRVEMALRLSLELCDSVITYRSRYLAVLQPAPALDLMLADEANPRGLAYQLAQSRDLLAEIAGEAAATSLAGVVATLLADVQAMVRDVATAADQPEVAIRLAPRLLDLRDAIAELSDQVSRRYFALLPAARSVGLEVQPALRGAA